MLDAIVAAALEDVERAGDVAAHVAVWILQRIAHSRLGGKMHDALKFFPREQILHAVVIGDIQLHEAKPGLPAQPIAPRFLESDVVIVVQIVEPDDLVPARQQVERSVVTDEARSAR